MFNLGDIFYLKLNLCIDLTVIEPGNLIWQLDLVGAFHPTHFYLWLLTTEERI